MKKIIKYLFALTVTLNMVASVSANTNIQPRFKGTLRSTGNVKIGNDTLWIIYTKPHQPHGIRSDEQKFRIFPDKNGHFEFKLPEFDKPLMLTIGLYYAEDTKPKGPRSGLIGAWFLVEKDDNININITKTGIHSSDFATFSGKGFEKYETAARLERLCSASFGSGEFHDGVMKIYYGKGQVNSDPSDKILQYCKLTEAMLKKKNDIISKSMMTSDMKRMVAYNNAPIYESWILEMFQNYTVRSKDNPALRSVIKKHFDEYKAKFNYEYDPLMSFCPKYLTRLARTEFNSLFMDDIDKRVEFQDLYEIFKNNYSGPVRELLICNLFIGGIGWAGTEALSQKLIDSLMTEGEKYISIPIIKNAYNSKLRLANGAEIYNGIFKDLNNNDISLFSLKGKVVFIDFWFTGCTACRAFHQDFHKEGYPSLKDNTDFVYLSICIDKDKEKWKKGIESGHYSSKEYLNLNSSLGNNDPFLKYYQRIQMPFLILVDKSGKISASNIVPNPKAVLSLINEVLDIPIKSK